MSAGGSSTRKRVLVTGAGRGIGRAVALGLAREGVEVICASLHASNVEQLRQAIDREGGRARAREMDVASRDSVEEAIDWAWHEAGPINGLVHAAGVSGTRPFLSITFEEWRRIIGTNLDGTFHVCQTLARRMVEAGTPGSLVVISSQLAHVAALGKAHYVASKGGVETLMRAMALELAPHGIRVNALAPGLTDTDLVRPSLAADAEYAERTLKRIPLNRIAKPEEIAAAASFLLSDGASYVTGSTLVVDGGYLAT